MPGSVCHFPSSVPPHAGVTRWRNASTGGGCRLIVAVREQRPSKGAEAAVDRPRPIGIERRDEIVYLNQRRDVLEVWQEWRTCDGRWTGTTR